MAYGYRLLREQPIASSSFVDVTPHCLLLLCLVGDRSVWQHATAPLLHAILRAAAATSELLRVTLVRSSSLMPRCWYVPPCWSRCHCRATAVAAAAAAARLRLRHPPPRPLVWPDSRLSRATVRDPCIARDPPSASDWSAAPPPLTCRRIIRRTSAVFTESAPHVLV
ncbi:hypothetical protein Syun_012785 [Stephania yunnanensis]|uniref:Uncharacterized protein n=1 Tax=Stephania yunnanensis TaxID=152371 RepID=A0AAP0K2A2_9MAGN